MGLRIDLPEPGYAVVRVDLCGLQRGVSEEFLYLPHIRAAVHQVRGERVPQDVGAFLALHSVALQFAAHRAVNRRAGYALSFPC